MKAAAAVLLISVNAMAQTCPHFNMFASLQSCYIPFTRNTPAGVTGSTPFTYTWQYDQTGAGDWVNFPTTPTDIYCNGINVGWGFGGDTNLIEYHAINQFRTYIRIPTRLTMSNSCGSYMAVNSEGLLFCAADINCDFRIDTDDSDAFDAMLAASNPYADFNHDGEVDFFDYLDFVDAYNFGCP